MIRDRKRVLPYLILVVLLGLAAVPVTAQTETATLSGRITDPSGAIVIGARVEILNINTNVNMATETNDKGFYFLSGLRPGTYRIMVRKEGFKQIVKSGVELHVQDIIAHNFELEVGSVIESVTVEAGAPLLNSQDAAVSTIVDREFIENLPLNGRSFHALLELTPGVVLTQTTSANQGQFSVNGQRSNANYFMVDGVSANVGITANTSQSAAGSLPALSTFGGTSNLVSVDALQEFRVQTSSYAAEYGRSPGGQVSISTRSGTNELHGTLFEYFRNDKLDAANWFANFFGLDKAPIRQNDFGGVLGGPIVEDRTFFFVSYEGLRLRQPRTPGLIAVPDMTSRQIAPVEIQPLLNAFPVPNGADLGGGFAGFSATYSDPSSLNATSVRIDHVANQKLTLFGRYNHAPSETRQRSRSFSTIQDVGNTTRTLTFGATMNLAPNMSNDVRANWSKTSAHVISVFDAFQGAQDPPDSSLFPPFASRDDSSFLMILGFAPDLTIGPSTDNDQRQLNLIDTFSLVHGAHQFKFGVDYRRLTPIFDGVKYEIIPIFLDMTDALAGTTFFTVVGANEIPIFPRITSLSTFAQDSWKTTPRLTLTYGVRWEYNPPPTEAKGQLPFALQGVDDPATLSVAPPGTRIWNPSYGNFAPRIGAAYQLGEDGNTVLRGGFGIFYDLGFTQAVAGMVTGSPYVRSNFLFFLPWPPDPTLVAPPPIVFDPPFPDRVFATDPDFKLPYTAQWNLALERQLGPNQTVSASYVGSAGRRLLRLEFQRNPNPDFSAISLNTNGAESDYHALQLQFQRRLSNGFQALASYTWSHSIDDVSSDTLFTPLDVGGLLDFGQERTSSDYDVRHSFTSSFTYDIPSPVSSGAGKAILGDWGVDAIVRAHSGTPVNITRGTIAGLSGAARPDLVAGVPIWIRDASVPGGRRLNSAAFDAATPSSEARQGNLGRNAVRGFASSQVDLSLRRVFTLSEQFDFHFRADFFNILNHPNFSNPVGRLGVPSFGTATQMLGESLGSGGSGGGFSPLYQVGGPRSIQIALKLTF